MAKEEQKQEKKAVEEDAPKGDKAEQAQAYQVKRAKARAAEAKIRTESLNKKLKEAGKDSFRVACTTKVIGSLVEPKSGQRIPAAGQGDVVVAGPLKEGSWLDSQISAGLVVVVD